MKAKSFAIALAVPYIDKFKHSAFIPAGAPVKRVCIPVAAAEPSTPISISTVSHLLNGSPAASAAALFNSYSATTTAPSAFVWPMFPML